jgi:hypothetical protein
MIMIRMMDLLSEVDKSGNRYKGDDYNIWLSNVDWIKCSMDRFVSIPYQIRKFGVNWVARNKDIRVKELLKYYTTDGNVIEGEIISKN